jgi:uridine kinase
MLIIGIAGGTGSGKTTVVHQIMNELPEKKWVSYHKIRITKKIITYHLMNVL